MSWFRRQTESRPSRECAADVQPRRRRFRFRLCLVAGTAVALAIAWPYIRLHWQLDAGRKALASGHPDVAVEYLQRAVEYAPRNAQALYRLGVAQRRAGRLDRASSSLERALKLGWSRSDVDLQMMLAIAQSGDIDTVDARLKAIMDRGADDEVAEEICEALAIGYLKTFRLREAWVILTYWSKWQPSAIFPKFWRADICRRSRNTQAEEQEYRDILAIDAGHIGARCRLAQVLKDSSRVEEAEREFERCLAKVPNHADALIGLAECRRRLANSAAAVPLLERALGLTLSSVQRSTVLEQLGQIEADGARWQDAIRHLEEAARLPPYKSSTLSALAQAYALAGDVNRAQELAQRSRIVSDQHERIEKITQSLTDHPGNAELRYEVGKILLDLGAKAEGERWLQTALKMNPTHQGARDLLASLSVSKDESGKAESDHGNRGSQHETTRN